MSKTLVVLAAGMGSRFGGLKQLAPVGPSGEFIADYSVYDAVRAGFEKIVFVLRKTMIEDFEATIGNRISAVVPVEYVFQELFNVPVGVFVPVDRKKPWGTGHAVLTARPAVDGPFAVVNADDFYGRQSYELLSRFLNETADDEQQYGMVGYKLSDTLSAHGSVSRGICNINNDGSLDSIVERAGLEPIEQQVRFLIEPNRWGYLSGSETVSMNIWGFKKSIFNELEVEFQNFIAHNVNAPGAEYMLPSMVHKMITAGKVKVKVMSSSGKWFGMTNPQDHAITVEHIKKMVEMGEYPSNLWA